MISSLARKRNAAGSGRGSNKRYSVDRRCGLGLAREVMTAMAPLPYTTMPPID